MSLNFRDECSCGGKGCDLCTVTYSINKLGPGMVYSSDIMPVNNPDLTVSDPLIPIIELKKRIMEGRGDSFFLQSPGKNTSGQGEAQ